MEWTITLQTDPPLTVVRVRGVLTVADCRAGIEELAAVKDPFCPLLIDDRGADLAGLTPEELMRIDSIFREHSRTFAFARTAIMVLGGEGREVAERWARLASSGGARAEIAVFTEEQEAAKWLSGLE